MGVVLIFGEDIFDRIKKLPSCERISALPCERLSVIGRETPAALAEDLPQ